MKRVVREIVIDHYPHLLRLAELDMKGRQKRTLTAGDEPESLLKCAHSASNLARRQQAC